ncbi:MAG: hypothetical protein WCT49_04290 [Candidatus Paceibacterota bacterium]|jgi:hypothetical protein|nr:hypothetical protein [Candidatus Paceibacterota bacterium]
MSIVHELNEKPELYLSSRAVYIYWRYQKYLRDPRLFTVYGDGSVLMSAKLPASASPGHLAQLHNKFINKGEICQKLVISSVDWKNGTSVHDKRLVFYCESGEVFTSGPLPPSENVPLLAQRFFKKNWIEEV